MRITEFFSKSSQKDERIDWSPEEALDEWRRLHPDSQALAEDVAAIQEALSQMANGERGIPFQEFDRDFRKRHNVRGQP